MDRPYLRMLFRPEVKEPTLITGLPGFGNIGKIVANLLIKFSQAELFAELYSPSFPDIVIVDKDGVCRLPRYEFYAPKSGRNIIILTGDVQPPLDDIPAHYEVCSMVLDLLDDFGCKYIITIGGIPSSQPVKEVYVAATKPEIAVDYMEKGAIIYGGGRIMGASGLLLGLAKRRGMEGVCILGSTMGLTADRESAFQVFRFLTKILEPTVEEV